MDWRWPGSVLLVNVLAKNVSISLTPFCCGINCCVLYCGIDGLEENKRGKFVRMVSSK